MHWFQSNEGDPLPQARSRTACAIRPALLLAALAVPGTLPGLARAQEAQASGQASATLIEPLVVISLDDLDFGLVSANRTQSGSVIVPPSQDGARYTGGAKPGCQGPTCPPPHPALFSVSGEAARIYEVEVGPQLSISSSTPGAPALTVGAFMVQALSRGAVDPTGQLDATGRDQFRIGATLSVPAGLAPARYRKVLPVSVSYQ